MISNDKGILNGLVLAGGKSLRMGEDKSQIKWHEKEQLYYVADLLNSICDDVCISCREEQATSIDTFYQVLTDKYEGKGPFGAILSAFTHQHDCAWLVVACDLPLLDKETLQYLIANRDTSYIATTFESPHDSLPEPLITIWEPQCYPILQSFLSEGISCPRKVLRSQVDKVKIIKPLNPEALMNANTPEDAAIVRNIIQQRMVNG
ncbi:MAG: NTP transferase domain-containing protein [Bacteroidetes bacterium]|nr:NTP transferase domain-containing protein [Bacteroidota bacterium]